MCLLARSPVGANVTIHFCPFLTTHHSRQPIRFTKETFTSKILENADDSKMESNIVTHQKIAIKYCDAPSSKLIKSTSAGHIEKENHYTTLLSEKTKISRAGLSEAWRRMRLAVWRRWRWSFKWKEMHSKENWYYCQRSDKCSKSTLMLQYQNEIPQNILFVRCIKRSSHTTPFLSFGCLESSYQVVLSLGS